MTESFFRIPPQNTKELTGDRLSRQATSPHSSPPPLVPHSPRPQSWRMTWPLHHQHCGQSWLNWVMAERGQRSTEVARGRNSLGAGAAAAAATVLLTPAAVRRRPASRRFFFYSGDDSPCIESTVHARPASRHTNPSKTTSPPPRWQRQQRHHRQQIKIN